MGTAHETNPSWWIATTPIGDTTEIDQDLRIDDESGGEIDGPADALRHVLGEETAHLVAEREVVGIQEQIQGASP